MSKKEDREEIIEGLSPRTFRASALVLEKISRWRASLEHVFNEVREEFNLSSQESRTVFYLSRIALLDVGLSIYVLERIGKHTLPLRRKSSFMVAVSLVNRYPHFEKRIEALRGGLLSNTLLRYISYDFLEKKKEEMISLPCVEKVSYKYSIPPLLSRRLVEYFGCSQAENVAVSFMRRHVWLRATGPEKIEKVVEFLSSRGIKYRRDQDFDFLFELLLPEYEPLPSIDSSIGVYQDKASIATVAELTGELSDMELFIDAAAAPFMKTSLLCGSLTGPKEIIAIDVSPGRIRDSMHNLRECVSPTHVVCADARIFSIRIGKSFDGALVDAPCTNSGALGADPGLRLSLWNLNTEEVIKYSARQSSILLNVLAMLKRGKKLVYSTCSLLPEEGEEVVARILSGKKSELLRPRLFFEPGYPKYDFAKNVTRLFPEKQRTEAFFISVMKKA
jgi:16S rRNA (cytosine967-C5)-methyltransferase